MSTRIKQLFIALILTGTFALPLEVPLFGDDVPATNAAPVPSPHPDAAVAKAAPTVSATSLTHMFVWGQLPSQFRTAWESALKANPELDKEHKQLMADLQAEEIKGAADMIQADPKVAPMVAKMTEIRQRAEAAASSPSGAPINSSPRPTFTPQDMQEFQIARDAVLTAHPEIRVEQQNLKQRMADHADKLYDAMVKIDPTVSSILAQAQAARAHAADPMPPSYDALDIDAMAARMKKHQDVYQRIRDDSLAAYAQSPEKMPLTEDVKQSIRLWAYLTVWGDYYGEGLYRRGQQAALKSMDYNGKVNTLGYTFVDVLELQSGHSPNDQHARRVNSAANDFLDTKYPVELKMSVAVNAISNLVKYKSNEHPDPTAASLKELPDLIQKWGQNYQQYIKTNPPHDLLNGAAHDLLCVVRDDEEPLNLAIAEIDRDFNETDPNSPVKVALDGEYFVHAAWCARGSGWANTVTDEGWNLFASRLDKAADILENGFAKYPTEDEMAVQMIDVELGQGQGKERMESWFQKAIKVDPDNYDAYKCKEWYLQPRWHGSEEEIITFGQECIKTDNWSAKLPMIFTTAIAEAATQDPDIYSRPEIWTIVEKTYRDYLTHYPKSTYCRTSFAKHAYDSGHLDIAKEQFQLLGNDYDISTVSTEEYAPIATKLGLR